MHKSVPFSLSLFLPLLLFFSVFPSLFPSLFTRCTALAQPCCNNPEQLVPFLFPSRPSHVILYEKTQSFDQARNFAPRHLAMINSCTGPASVQVLVFRTSDKAGSRAKRTMSALCDDAPALSPSPEAVFLSLPLRAPARDIITELLFDIHVLLSAAPASAPINTSGSNSVSVDSGSPWFELSPHTTQVSGVLKSAEKNH